ncbi:hypothetical protein [Thermoactinospora rubra]|uniref:hypothetical protein n=1 Tax=Thermoactinospora rubra TaxID=1088767 RepID=UPI000A1120BE|nr:hypothetical protein [Thermoactinospora rubra]
MRILTGVLAVVMGAALLTGSAPGTASASAGSCPPRNSNVDESPRHDWTTFARYKGYLRFTGATTYTAHIGIDDYEADGQDPYFYFIYFYDNPDGTSDIHRTRRWTHSAYAGGGWVCHRAWVNSSNDGRVIDHIYMYAGIPASPNFLIKIWSNPYAENKAGIER